VPYEIVWDTAAMEELSGLRAFKRRIVVATVEEQLRDQAETETNHRKPLREPVDELPDGSWELRIGDLRVFYWIANPGTAVVLRVIIKGNATLKEALGRGGE
jgi:mRNA-degrading endonuclease RelE of RelBE toxin-antitoxin system